MLSNAYVEADDQEHHIILQAKWSLLFSGGPWEKKSSNNKFDVTMGSLDRTESSTSKMPTLKRLNVYVLKNNS